MSGLHEIKAMSPEGRRALRINDFCKAYGISRSTVYKLANEKKLRLCKIGGRSLIRVEDAEALLSREG
jgi:excisionase family DNA binding protein